MRVQAKPGPLLPALTAWHMIGAVAQCAPGARLHSEAGRCGARQADAARLPLHAARRAPAPALCCSPDDATSTPASIPAADAGRVAGCRWAHLHGRLQRCCWVRSVQRRLTYIPLASFCGTHPHRSRGWRMASTSFLALALLPGSCRLGYMSRVPALTFAQGAEHG